VITQAEAARQLGLSRPRISVLVKQRRLPTVQYGKRRYVLSLDVKPPGSSYVEGDSQVINRDGRPRLPREFCVVCGDSLKGNAYKKGHLFMARCKSCHRRTTMFHLYRKNAEKRGLTFDLSASEFADLTREPCAYCAGYRANNPNGVDRVDSAKGYVRGNVVSACKTCNLAKNQSTVEEWTAWLKRIKAAPMPEVLE